MKVIKNVNVFTSIVLYQHAAEDLSETLSSLLASSIIKKIILVDNSGCEWADKLDNKKIIYIKSEKNGGFGYGHNLAINKFVDESDFFLICNPDISFEPTELERFIDIAQRRPEGLFSPKVLYPDGRNQYGQRLLPTPANLFARRFLPIWAEKLDEHYLLKNYDMKQLCFVPSLSGCFMLFRSPALKSLGGFDERFFMYMEDIDISRRCAAQFGNCYIPNVKVYHKHEQASYKNTTLLKAHITSAIQYFNKWGWFFDSIKKALNQQTIDELKCKIV